MLIQLSTHCVGHADSIASLSSRFVDETASRTSEEVVFGILETVPMSESTEAYFAAVQLLDFELCCRSGRAGYRGSGERRGRHCRDEGREGHRASSGRGPVVSTLSYMMLRRPDA